MGIIWFISFDFLANFFFVYSIYNKLKKLYIIIYYSKDENLLNKLLSIILYMIIVIDHYNTNIVKIILFIKNFKYNIMF